MRWWKRYTTRLEVLPSYLFIALGATLGVLAVDQLSEARSADNRTVLVLLCEEAQKDRIAVRELVGDIADILPEPFRTELLETRDRRLPGERECSAALP